MRKILLVVVCFISLLNCFPDKKPSLQKTNTAQDAILSPVPTPMLTPVPTPNQQSNRQIADELLDKMVVDRISIDWDQDLVLRGSPGGKTEEILWNTFINQPYEKQFNTLTAEDWYDIYDQFKSKLIALAKDKQLPYAVLEKYLAQRKPKPDATPAFIPIGAYLTDYENEEVFLIIFKCTPAWTYTDENNNPVYFEFLESWVVMVSVKDLEGIIATTSC